MTPQTPEQRNELVLSVTSAHRDRDAHGEIRAHRAWHDLDEAGRIEAHDETRKLRALESVASADGLTSTARAVLSRIKRAP